MGQQVCWFDNFYPRASFVNMPKRITGKVIVFFVRFCIRWSLWRHAHERLRQENVPSCRGNALLFLWHITFFERRGCLLYWLLTPPGNWLPPVLTAMTCTSYSESSSSSFTKLFLFSPSSCSSGLTSSNLSGASGNLLPKALPWWILKPLSKKETVMDGVSVYVSERERERGTLHSFVVKLCPCLPFFLWLWFVYYKLTVPGACFRCMTLSCDPNMQRVYKRAKESIDYSTALLFEGSFWKYKLLVPMTFLFIL